MDISILNVLKLAGLTVSEFAELCGVSRVAVYKWAEGSAIHPLRKQKVEKLLAAIASATQDKDFPPKLVLTRKNEAVSMARRDEIRKTVLDHVKKIQNAA